MVLYISNHLVPDQQTGLIICSIVFESRVDLLHSTIELVVHYQK